MIEGLPAIHKIRFENMHFQYEGHPELFTNINFEFPTEKIVWINAEGGAGRSILLQLLAGLQLPGKGSYWINDQDVAKMSFEEFLPYRLSIGFGFDYGGLINNRTTYENLSLPLLYHKMLPEEEVKARVEMYMDEVGLLKYRDLRPSFIPGGMRKLTCVLRAIIHHPQILLLDDPSVGLGHETTLKVFELILRLRELGYFQHFFFSSYDQQLLKMLHNHEIVISQTEFLSPAKKKVVGL